MQPVHFVTHALQGSSHVGHNYRPPEHPGFRNHQTEDFPPDRGHDAPIDACHAARKLVDFVGSIEYHVLLGDWLLTFALEKLLNVSTAFFRGITDIVAIDLNHEIREPRGPQILDRAQDDLNTL